MRIARPLAATAAVLLVAALATFAVLRSSAPANAALGDASCDGTINAIDATVILQFTAALIPSLGCPQNADADHNGSVGATDATLVLQFVAGLIPSLGPTPTATPTRTATSTPTPSATPGLPTATPAATPTSTATGAPAPTNTVAATSTATATATPGASPGATFTPTRTPTPLSTVHVRNASTYVDSFGDMWAVGEVYNGLNHDVAFVSVEVQLYDAANQPLLKTPEVYNTCVTSIERHKDSPFGVIIFGPPPNVDHADIHVYQTNDPEDPFNYIDLPSDLADPPVHNVNVAITEAYRQPSSDGTDFFHVAGEMTNKSNNGQVYDFPLACIAVYDDRGVVVRMTSVPTDDDPLEAHATTQFNTEETDDLNVSAINPATSLTARAWVDAFYEEP